MAYPTLRFQVYFEQKTQPVAAVSKVSGLTRKTNTIEFKQGGSQLVEKGPGMTTYDDVTLERGLTQDRDFEAWANATQSIDHGFPSSSPADLRREVRIVLLDYAMNPVIGWIIHQAWPSEFQAISDFDAGGNTIAIEHLKLVPLSWERDLTITPPGS
jgi:phage tail-like protein